VRREPAGSLRGRRDRRDEALQRDAAAPRGVRREGLSAARDHSAHDAYLDFAVEIASVPIVREPDGLALSSRNAYLTAEQRRAALALSKGLAAAEAAVKAGVKSAAKILAAARAPIDAETLARIDYVELRDADELSTVETLARRAVLAMAVFVGTTRLIDNRVLG
jgi:pantoate--beta-alanine ligase